MTDIMDQEWWDEWNKLKMAQLPTRPYLVNREQMRTPDPRVVSQAVQPLPRTPMVDRTYPALGVPMARPMSPINVPTPPRTPMVDTGASRFDMPHKQPRPMDYHPHAQYYDETRKAQEQATQKRIQSKRVPETDGTINLKKSAPMRKTPMLQTRGKVDMSNIQPRSVPTVWDGTPYEGNRWKPDFSLNEYNLPRGLFGARDEQGRQTHRGLLGGISGWAKDFFNDPSRVALTQAGLTAMNPNSYYDKEGFSSGLGGLNRALTAGVKTYQDLMNPIGGQSMSEFRRTLKAYNALPKGHPDRRMMKMRLDKLASMPDSASPSKKWNAWLQYRKMLPPEKRNDPNEYQKFVRSQQWLDAGPSYKQPPAVGTGETREVKKGLAPKDELPYLEKKEEATTRGRINSEAVTQAKLSLPDSIASAKYMITLLDDAMGHDGMKDVIGLPDNPLVLKGIMPATDAADFIGIYKQITGKQFMEAYKTLKGGGQITEIEGEKATDAMARMSKSQSETAFLKALRDFREVVLVALERQKTLAGTFQEKTTGTNNGFQIKRIK